MIDYEPQAIISREMSESRAYWALSGTACAMLTRLLMFKNMKLEGNRKNPNMVAAPYRPLVNLFGKKANGKPDGLWATSIARSFDSLLAKGFIRVEQQGGNAPSDFTMYEMIDDWKSWQPGKIFRTRRIRKAKHLAGTANLKGNNTQCGTK